MMRHDETYPFIQIDCL